jgi:ATP-dependent DNA helicase RecG
MEPTLRPEFTVEDIEGETVVAVEIEEVPANQKPCYYKPNTLQKGAFIRIGNTNRLMTDYEIFGYVSAREQPRFDEEIVGDATWDDLAADKVQAYLARPRQARPRASHLQGDDTEVLSHLRLVRPAGTGVRPTLAGLLMFGKYPQEFEPQLVITFLKFFGASETEKGPRGERFMDNQKFDGPIPELIQTAVDYVLASVRKSSLIEGLYRRDIPEYPEEAVREAITNAVAHRDYSPFVRGSDIQIRLFADRLEIQSPGGLYGNVSEETLEQEQSTRNRILIRFMEETPARDGRFLVENRGSGMKAMLESMRQANLEPPRFDDRRSSFWVIFRNHTLMGPEAIAWLSQFSTLPLNDRQRLALVYLRNNERMANSDYQRLSRVDPLTAGRELRGLVQAGLAEQQSVKRWTYYTLKAARELPVLSGPESEEEKIIARVREKGSITNAECRELLTVDDKRAWYLLRKLMDAGRLKAAKGAGRRTVAPVHAGLTKRLSRIYPESFRDRFAL